MAESGLWGQFWFSAAVTAKDARYVSFKENINTTQWAMMHGSKKDVFKGHCLRMQSLGRSEQGPKRERKAHLAALEAIYLGFASDHNMSANKFYLPDSKKEVLFNQGRFDKTHFTISSEKFQVIEQDKKYHLFNILCRVPTETYWVHIVGISLP